MAMKNETHAPDPEKKEGDWSRTELALGRDAVRRLLSATVAVVGLGGVGGYVVEALARAPVGHLILVDPDSVESSNFNRQIAAVTGTLGLPKTAVLAERIHAIRPETTVAQHTVRITRQNVDAVLGQYRPDCVVDAIDSVDDKVALLQWCVRNHIPVVSSMGAGRRLDPTRVRVAPLAETRGCPLAREVRRRLRDSQCRHAVRAVFSEEPPIRTRQHAGDRDHGAGRESRAVPSVSWTPGAFGLACAAETVRLILLGAAPG